jgi:hypothetical protein
MVHAYRRECEWKLGELRDKFCLSFFPSPVSSLYEGISFAFSRMRRNP